MGCAQHRPDAQARPLDWAAHPRNQDAIMSKEFSGAPQFVKYLGPVLEALQQLGGSGRPDEVRSVIAQRLKVSEAEQSEELPSKAQPRFDNQVHWARFYLAKAGFLDSSKRGVWALTDQGRTSAPLSDAAARKLFREVSGTFAKSKANKAQAEPAGAVDDQPVPASDATVTEQNYRSELTTRFQALSPAGFERFFQRLLG